MELWLDFFNEGIIQNVIYSWFFVIIFIWFWTILWVVKDISNRTDSFFLQFLSILISIVPFFWIMIYFLIRPIRYKFDKIFWRESIIANTMICPKCWNNNLKENNYCDDCWESLKCSCKECKQKFPITDEYCKNCGAPNIDMIN